MNFSPLRLDLSQTHLSSDRRYGLHGSLLLFSARPVFIALTKKGPRSFTRRPFSISKLPRNGSALNLQDARPRASCSRRSKRSQLLLFLFLSGLFGCHSRLPLLSLAAERPEFQFAVRESSSRPAVEPSSILAALFWSFAASLFASYCAISAPLTRSPAALRNFDQRGHSLPASRRHFGITGCSFASASCAFCSFVLPRHFYLALALFDGTFIQLPPLSKFKINRLLTL